MVKQKKQTPARRIDKSTENEKSFRLLSRSNPPTDDLIVSLSDAYENKRARQVVEWEKLAKQKAQPTI